MTSAATPEGDRANAPLGLIVEGMNCAACARHVAEAIEAVPGVARVQVLLDQGRARVLWGDGAAHDWDAAVRAVGAAGYGARVEPAPSRGEAGADAGATEPGAGQGAALAGWWFNVVFGSALTGPLAAGDWILGLGANPAFHWVGLALSAPVLAVCGRRFFRGAWMQLRRGQSNMDTLVTLGSTTAFGYSLWGLLQGGVAHLYFMEAAAIITLISVGHWLELRMSARAADTVRRLLTLAPATARLQRADGQELEIAVATLRVGDRIVLKPGDRVPTDARVVEGASALDESMLTGEAMPVEKQAGAMVYGGTLNRNGRLVARVLATGQATALAQIVAVVERAQSSRARIQRLADRVSSVFVPIVVAVAMATGLAWGLAPGPMGAAHAALAGWLWPGHVPGTALAAAIVHAVAVLIVACPCAMGLATPAAIMAGANAAARRGILIRDGAALEKSGRITTVVFDKTGTLTQGIPGVAEVHLLPPRAADDAAGSDLRALAAGLAQPSDHPLSRAVAAWAAGAPPLSLEGWEERRGEGVCGRLPSAAASAGAPRLARLGSLSWLAQVGVVLGPVESWAASRSAHGCTVLGVAVERSLVGLISLRDAPKPRARAVVERLVREGMTVMMITGDGLATAQAVAGELGLAPDAVLAQVRPEAKAEWVRQLQERGQQVAFVGDGINDAPALAQADLGIAVSRASDVAREAADVLLLRSDIEAVPEALELARATLRTIRQNLFWAFFYNAAAIPLAALGFMTPVLCAAAMGASDLVVLGNALRLSRRMRYGALGQ
jgi:Cu+-exporting ATPase